MLLNVFMSYVLYFEVKVNQTGYTAALWAWVYHLQSEVTLVFGHYDRYILSNLDRLTTFVP